MRRSWLSMLCAAAAAVVALGLSAPARAHSRTGGYENMARDVPRDWESPYELVRGVPMVDYGTFRARNPVTAAQYGLAAWSQWIHFGDRGRLRVALRVADWLLAAQRSNGMWPYQFPYKSPGTTMDLPNPWGSALAQGQAISLLRRAYAATGRRAYLAAARRGLVPLSRNVLRGGLARWHRGGIMFEEYPAARPSLPLNGHLQTLIGLYDLSDVSPRAAGLFRRGVRTAARTLPEYDAGNGWSYYNLVHEVGFDPVPAQPGYHAAHVALLRIVDRLAPHRAFRVWASRWAPAAAASAWQSRGYSAMTLPRPSSGAGSASGR